MNKLFTEKQLAGFRSKLECQVLTAGDQDYDSVRRVWNGMIDRKPSIVARPSSIADVMRAVRFVREDDLPFTVRGGGHSVSGKSVADDAVMIDLSRMKGIRIDPAGQSAVVQGGATWGELDREAETYRLATTGGVISTTGVAGLTLGGGIGWLMGKHGLSCDNVISADLVSADGTHMSLSANKNEDLFWAIRGGGGNFGIVTALEFRLHSLKSVEGGVLLYPRSAAFDLLRHYRDVTVKAPDELTAYAALMTGHGSPLAGVAFCHSGARLEAAGAGKQFFLADAPMADMTGEKKYTEVQSMLDFTAPAGLHYYFKCPFVTSPMRPFEPLWNTLSRLPPNRHRWLLNICMEQPAACLQTIPVSVCVGLATASTSCRPGAIRPYQKHVCPGQGLCRHSSSRLAARILT